MFFVVVCTEQVQFAKLSKNVAASREFTVTTKLSKLRPLVLAALGKSKCKMKLVLQYGQLVEDLGDLTLERQL